MFKLKNHRILKNTLKTLSFFVIMHFYVSISFCYDWVPFNALANWVDKTEKNIKINSTN